LNDFFFIILAPVAVALALSIHLGYTWTRLWLPGALRPYRALLTAPVGCAVLVTLTAALTLTTALTPPQIAAGLALLAIPLNLWAWRNAKQKPEARSQKPEVLVYSDAPGTRRTSSVVLPTTIQSKIQNPKPKIELLVVLLALLSFTLTILPTLHWGISAPVGRNWDPADVYVPLGKALQTRSQRDVGEFPRNPLVNVFATPPVIGRVHGFSFLHASASSATGVDPLYSFTPLLALMLAFVPPATYVLGRMTGLGRWAAFLATGLVALAWLPLWVTYNGFAEHVQGMPLLLLALAGSIVALRNGGTAAITSGALFTAALATGYYPALTIYVALLLPVALLLLLRPGRPADNRPPIPDPQPATPRRSVVQRGLLLAVLAFLLSLPAQASFFLEEGFLDEMRRGNSGFQIGSFVGLADLLGLTATFRGERGAAASWLVLPAVAAALVFAAAGVLFRRVPLVTALLAGVLLYLGYTAAERFHYGFYKGVTFTIPIVSMLIAAGAGAAWQWCGRAITRPAGRRALHVGIVTGMLLIIGLNAWTVGQIQRSYADRGPRLWSLQELEVAAVGKAVPPGADVLIVPSKEHPRTFYSLVSYALLGHELFGNFPTAYTSLSAGTGRRLPTLALIPDGIDPAAHGYQANELRWSGAGMRLYGRSPGVRYHRALGKSGRYPELAPGQVLTLRLGAQRIALPGENTPEPGSPEPAQIRLALASFGPTAIELRTPTDTATHTLPGGLVELPSAPLLIPNEVTLRNTGEEPVYLWWGELREPGTPAALRLRDDVFMQLRPEPVGRRTEVAANLRLRTQPLPDGDQKLTALIVVSYAPGKRDWREVGQWVFFPTSGTFRLEADLQRLNAAVRRNGQPLDLAGSAAPAGDGTYQASLLLANDAEIVYATTIWNWKIADGNVTAVTPDSVTFEVLPLPRPTTPLLHRSADGTLQLRGYSLPQRAVRPGETRGIQLVWQSLRKIHGDRQARLALRRADGQILAEQTALLGRSGHGTATWQEGELSEQTFEVRIPASASPGPATLTLELIGPDGTAIPFAEANGSLELTQMVVER
jgi:hypothetical protein